MKPHKNLDAWKLSFEFVKKIYLATASFPSEEKFGLVRNYDGQPFPFHQILQKEQQENQKKNSSNFYMLQKVRLVSLTH